eukprot:TRINITY_DN14992_c0_g1_i2.p1 TRINITY_DN14992_c0_g1~~TRINITY_DN14992_c0_g1_i2.p1  ORF type:complete len:803 (+),score=153.54 TRINITY_DN14992_c0_g1_i2:81-2489(+)
MASMSPVEELREVQDAGSPPMFVRRSYSADDVANGFVDSVAHSPGYEERGGSLRDPDSTLCPRSICKMVAIGAVALGITIIAVTAFLIGAGSKRTSSGACPADPAETGWSVWNGGPVAAAADGPVLDARWGSRYARGNLSALVSGERLNAWTGLYSNPGRGGAAMRSREWKEFAESIAEQAAAAGIVGPALGIGGARGAEGVSDAVTFPSPLNVAATFDVAHASYVGRTAASDAAASGLRFVTSPTVTAVHDTIDPSGSYGDEPGLVSMMVAGFVGAAQASAAVLAPVGDLPALTLQEAAEPLEAAVAANLTAVQIGSESCSDKYTHGLLREVAGFEGLVLADWGSEWHQEPLTRGWVDVLSSDSLPGGALTSVPHKQTRERRLQAWLSTVPSDPAVASVGRLDSMQRAADIAAHSAVLLENVDDVLPIPAASTVLLTGPAADSLHAVSHGWLRRPDAVFHEHSLTLRQAMREVHSVCYKFLDGAPHSCDNAPGCKCHHHHSYNGVSRCIDCSAVEEAGSPVRFVQGVLPSGDRADDYGDALHTAQQSHVVVVAVADPLGARPPVQIPRTQCEYVRELVQTGTPVVVVLFTHGPRILRDCVEGAKAVLYAGIPGPDGSFGVAQVLLGGVRPSGRLPFTYPDEVVTLQRISPDNTRWPFGWGMQYDDWSYTDVSVAAVGQAHRPACRGDCGVSVTAAELRSGVVLAVSVKVERVRGGGEAAEEESHSVLLSIVRQTGRGWTGPRLRRVTVVKCVPGQSVMVQAGLTVADFTVYGVSSKQAQRGRYAVHLGSSRSQPGPSFEIV